MSSKSPRTVAELYAEYNSVGEQAKALYDTKDVILKKLVRVWKKNKQAKIDEGHVLEIEDNFRGAVKAFAPGFAHRYKLKERAVAETE